MRRTPAETLSCDTGHGIERCQQALDATGEPARAKVWLRLFEILDKEPADREFREYEASPRDENGFINRVR